jgi:hypothetical protein
MCWATLLQSIVDNSVLDANSAKRREARVSETLTALSATAKDPSVSGSPEVVDLTLSSEKTACMVAVPAVSATVKTAAASHTPADKREVEACFQRIWAEHVSWAASVLNEAVAYARDHEPRDSESRTKLSSVLAWLNDRSTSLRRNEAASKPQESSRSSDISSAFAESVWPSLKARGWKAEAITVGPSAGKTRFTYGGNVVSVWWFA